MAELYTILILSYVHYIYYALYIAAEALIDTFSLSYIHIYVQSLALSSLSSIFNSLKAKTIIILHPRKSHSRTNQSCTHHVPIR